MNKNKFYVTTPIYYVNSKPHIGTLYSTLLADVSARFNRLLGKKVFFLTGTDEHGQKVAEKAAENKMQPKEFVDKIVVDFKKMWELYEIDYDKFIRTTDNQHQEMVTQWIKNLYEKGDIYKSVYSGLYCVPCETFVTLEKATDEKVCPSCKRELRELSEENYFFRLSAYQDRLLEFYKQNPEFITPKEKLNEVISFVSGGLQDLSISRKGVTWGIPFPLESGQTVYVWADALNNYLSAVGYLSSNKQQQEDFDFWWPANVQVMGKDILRFHAVYWPAFLMASGLSMPKKLLVHGYILSGENKMSKSLGNAVDPQELASKYGVEQVRYYLLKSVSVNQDSQFSIEDLEGRISSDLANNLGNLLSRTTVLAINNGFSEINSPEVFDPASEILKIKSEEMFKEYCDELNHYQYHIALSKLWTFISQVNAYFNDRKPWESVKKNKDEFEETIAVVCNSLYSVAHLLWPVMPKKMEELISCIGHKIDLTINNEEILRKNIWDKNFKITKPKEALFERPAEKSEAAVDVKKESSKKEKVEGVATVDEIGIEDFAKVQLCVGEILSCEVIDGSDKLYKLEVDFGSLGKKQILSGVRQYFTPTDLIGKKGVYVLNLKPRKMLGFESQGMMLFAKDDKSMTFVTVGSEIKNGTRLS
ncbi:TPA: methionine--tRNA ligase [Candidatus Dependentiae bacterium]|nr:MAG: Methionine-tRNA ligase [candidate division TM6 bacterium GW2011_GWE2_31_21]KKP53093.1 MAG: Methionine-tRNA ligase [candidate division TM6 bacterium GW2011_GWF2_33_332]HBS47911.1 methionine--tRNA ligase [Candidatus Dependentiae bacterium]HBZ73485.1 methionine--tRNA ligase [Candidatus Dependentiae bacterium]